MIIAYHAIFTTYGTWLPNDPRGSFSNTLYNAELAQLREISYGRQFPHPDRNTLRRFRAAAMPRLARQPYYITNETRHIVAEAFARVVERLRLSVPACAIMNDHVHFLVWRSKQTIEYLVNQLKGGATSALGTGITLWSRGFWKVFINDELALRAAARYIEANPEAGRLKLQRWGFVAPLPPEA